ncbi:hypothetical protein R1sor_017119 [Riccia sorocarpa]|uniref:Multicopper oxidase n=1 Tax=Riccia sorocarpa TaxID=122646 RepID=A0ABD3I8P4_9MARC
MVKSTAAPKPKATFIPASYALVAIIASFACLVSSVYGEHSVCQQLLPSPDLTPFIDPLPIPKTIDVSVGKHVIGAYKITQKLHPDLPPTTLYAYGTSQETATYPGPTLEATRETGKKFVSQNYTYPNSQTSTLLWYHDHTVGITRNNVLAGLAGIYILRDPSNDPKSLPSGQYEIPLILQDRQFWANGSINFPDIGDSPTAHANWCPEYFGDTLLVNGKVWPYLEVYPAKYRLRLLNGANARFFNLTISEPSMKFIQIGTDGGFLPYPLTLDYLILAPAYRLDVIIDFSKIPPGSKIYLNNSAAAPYPSGDDGFIPRIPSVLEFRVLSKSPKLYIPHTSVPKSFVPVPRPRYSLKRNLRRRLTLTEADDDNGPLFSLLDNRRWEDAVTEIPKLGSVEVWDLINLTPDAHPIHLHLIHFLFVQQQEFNQTLYELVGRNGGPGCSLEHRFGHPESCFTEAPRGANHEQIGWKDTVVVYPSTVTRLWTKWTNREGKPFPFDATSGPGYVWHCHILDHEDNDMMRPLKVVN